MLVHVHAAVIEGVELEVSLDFSEVEQAAHCFKKWIVVAR